MTALISTPLFGLCLSLTAYLAAAWLCRKLRLTFLPPLLIAAVMVIAFLRVTGIPVEAYNKGGDIIAMFLAPATAALAYSVYGQYEVLKKNLLPVAAGCGVGAAVSMLSIYGLIRLFGLSGDLTVSLLPKSVTTPIAMSLSAQLGGIEPVTVAAVIVTGMTGNILSPYLVRILRVDNPVAAGLGIGTCSHAVGTARALEMGEVEGAMSGLATGVTGFVTVLLAMLLG